MRRTRLGSSAACAPYARAGFSLIELMTVLLILSMIATAVYVALDRVLPRAQLNDAVRGLAGTLQETRSNAISRGLPFTVEYAFEEGEGHPRGYRVITPFRGGGLGGIATRAEERQANEWHPLPKNVEFNQIRLNGVTHDSGMITVEFDARGSASDHVIELLQQPGGSYYTLEVQALSGLIQMHDGKFERDPPDDGDFK